MTPRRVEAYFRNAKGELVRRLECGRVEVMKNVPPKLDLRTLPRYVHCEECERALTGEGTPPEAA